MIEFYEARIKALHSALNCQLRSDGRRSDDVNFCTTLIWSAVFVAFFSLPIIQKIVNSWAEVLLKFKIYQISRK